MVTAQEQRVVVGSTLKTAVKVDCSNFGKTYGGPFFFAHRVDLHNELRRLATQSDNPVEIVLNSEVTSYSPDGSVTLEDGSVHAADLIVAADGVHSIADKAIIDDASPAVPTGQAAFRFLLPTEQVASNPAAAALLEDGVMKILTGPDGRRLVWYPCAEYVYMTEPSKMG
jgi:salicylate hydroxylase